MYITIMIDVTHPSEPAQSMKRPLDIEPAEDKNSPQLDTPQDSAATATDKVQSNGVAGAKAIHHEESDSGRPAAKRVKLDNGEPEAQPINADARDRVKGVALVKEE
jgi:hypothetical protein